MSHTLRFLWVTLRALRAERLPPLAPSRITVRVGLTDLDVFGHVTNSQYLALLNLGRLDLVVRSGWVGLAWAARAPMLLCSLHIRYQKPLSWREKIEVETRPLCWDERWLYLEQRIYRGGSLVTRALAQTTFKGSKGTLAPATLMGGEHAPPSPPFPEEMGPFNTFQSLWGRQ